MKVQPFDSFDSFIFKLPQKKIRFEHKYNEDWEDTLLRCAYALKILVTIVNKFKENRDKYNLLIKTRLFYSNTTVLFEFERNTYTLIINTGLGDGVNPEIKNQPVKFEPLFIFFEQLIEQMINDLPKQRANELMFEIIQFVES
jgi:hypothetical protein